MPTPNRSDEVPLAVWPVSPGCGAHPSDRTRRRLAARVVECYAAAGGAVLDVAPSGGDVGHAAVQAGPPCVVVALAPGDGSLDAFEGTFDLAVALPPEDALRGGEPYEPPAAAIAFAAQSIRPGGLVVVAVAGSAAGDPIGRAVEAAARHGLAYIQHVVALLDHGIEQRPGASAERQVCHADVLVLSKGRP